ncbi:MAG: MerR family transcriptional regulator [Acidimicrobiia bacterium]|nr:MerR family transcriptional regulator [Acidimicrobiia bacterium]
MPDAAFSLDGLAAASGVTPRTIRYYQSEGLLPVPDRVGREARYHSAHAERLRVIGELQARGLRLTAIAELLRSAPDGIPADDWLGLGESLRRPWVEDQPALLRRGDLDERLAGLPEDALGVLVRLGIVERRADTSPVVWLVPSPGLLEVAIETVRLGIPAGVAARLRQLLESRLRDLATDLVARFTEEVSAGHLAAGRPGELAHLLDELQPITRRTVDLLFAHEMERAQRDLLDATDHQETPR